MTVWAESLSGEPDYGPYPDEVAASLAMDDLGLSDNSYKLVSRPARPPAPLYPEVTVHLSTGNIGAIMATVRDAMRRAGVPDYETVVSSMWAEIFRAESYTESLAIVMRYVSVT